jgi:hypothetical protein
MTYRSRLPRAVLGAVAAVATLGAAACSGSSHDETPTPSPHSSSSTSTPTRTKPAHHPAPRNPFTGLGPVPKNPTIAVKIDDTEPGRPQVNIDKADVVYIEAVEGGLTRLAAIYASHLPRAVGYVRSTRPSDPDLLLQYGKITEAYSGGAHDSLPRIHRSGIRSWDMDAGARYYHRVSRVQSDYINVVLNVKQVAKHVKTAHPHSIGWTFDKSLKGMGHLRKAPYISTVVTGSYSSGTPVAFRFDKKLGKYVRYIGPARQKAGDGKPVAATNVIVQYCHIHSHPRDTDINGNPSQFTITVGKGKVLVFRQGRRVVGTWTRHKLTQGTTLRTRKGKRIPLAPGNTWVVLVRRGIPTHS